LTNPKSEDEFGTHQHIDELKLLQNAPEVAGKNPGQQHMLRYESGQCIPMPISGTEQRSVPQLD
jgi:hypothetical protein